MAAHRKKRHSTAGASLAWTGQARVATGLALFTGSIGDHRVHAHPAIQLVVPAAPTQFKAQIAGETVASVAGVLIGSQVAHRLGPGTAALIYVEAASDAGRALGQAYRAPWHVLPETIVRRLRSLLTRPEALGLAELLTALEVGVQTTRVDVRASAHRVEAVLDRCAGRLESSVPARALAAEALLSERQFSVAVRSIRGMPLRPYLRWLRLEHAVKALGRGESATRAAQSAGFADAAHFTRTLQRHFGVSPRTLAPLLRR